MGPLLLEEVKDKNIPNKQSQQQPKVKMLYSWVLALVGSYQLTPSLYLGHTALKNLLNHFTTFGEKSLNNINVC